MSTERRFANIGHLHTGTYLPLSAGANNALTGDLWIVNTQPNIWLKDTDSAANGQVWRFVASGTTFYAQIFNDAISAGETWLSFTRSGITVGELMLYASPITINGAIIHNGGYTVKATDTQVTIYETDSADTADRVWLNLNANILNIQGYDASAGATRQFLAGNITSGDVSLNNGSTGGHTYVGNTNSGKVTYLYGADYVNLVVNGNTIYSAYYYNNSSTLSHYVVGNSNSFGFLNESSNWTMQYTRSTLLTWFNGTVQSAANMRLASGYALYLDGSTGIYVADPSSASYGTITLYGSKNTYAGIQFISAYQSRYFMFSTSVDLWGVYNTVGGIWDVLYNQGTLSWAAQTKYGLYALTGSWGSSYQVTRGAGAKTSGGTDGDIYIRTDSPYGIYHNISGTWVLVG